MNHMSSEYAVNTYYCFNKETGEQFTPDVQGYITPPVGSTLVFPSPYNDDIKQVMMEDVLIVNGSTPVKVQFDGNERYPEYIPANGMFGYERVPIHEIKILSGGGSLFIRGLSSDT